MEKKLAQSGTVRDKWWPDGTGIHEVTFALQPFELKLELYGGARGAADEWKKSFDRRKWLTGTIDWLGYSGTVVIGGTRWWVDDFKTGAWPVDVTRSKQLRSYALVPWFIEGRPGNWSADVSITQWSRYPLGAEPVRSWDVVTGLEMMEHLDDVRWALEHPKLIVVAPDADFEDGGKLHPCSGCECRESFPASDWMQNFWYRTLPMCAPGMVKRIYG